MSVKAFTSDPFDVATLSEADILALIAASTVGLFDYKGGYNAATNTPDLDTTPIAGILKGDSYTVTADGLFFTEALEAGDLIVAEVDTPTVLADWTRVNKNVEDVGSATWKTECRAATTENFILAEAPDAQTGGHSTSNIDGVVHAALTAGVSRILVPNQTDLKECGIYDYNGPSSLLTRSSDFDADSDIRHGAIIQVGSGVQYADTIWSLAASGVITIGVDNLTFRINAGNSLLSTKGAGTGVIHVSKEIHATDTRINNDEYQRFAPWKTIQAAIDFATAGDLILVHAGTYPEDITMKTGVDIHCERGVSLGSTSAAPSIDFAGTGTNITGLATIIGNNSGGGNILVTADNVVIDCYEIADGVGESIEITGGRIDLRMLSTLVPLTDTFINNSGGTVTVRDSSIIFTGAGDKLVNSSSGSAFTVFFNCDISDAVALTEPITITNGVVRLRHSSCVLSGKVTLSAGTFDCNNSLMQFDATNAFELSGGTISANDCSIFSADPAGGAMINLLATAISKVVAFTNCKLQNASNAASTIMDITVGETGSKTIRFENCALITGAAAAAALENSTGSSVSIVLTGTTVRDSAVSLLGDDITNSSLKSGACSNLTPTNEWIWLDENTLVSPVQSLKATGTQTLAAGTPQLPTGYSLSIKSVKPYVVAVAGATDGLAEIGLGISGDTVELVPQYNASTLLLVNNADFHAAGFDNGGDLVKSLSNEVFVADTGVGATLDIRYIYDVNLVKD